MALLGVCLLVLAITILELSYLDAVDLEQADNTLITGHRYDVTVTQSGTTRSVVQCATMCRRMDWCRSVNVRKDGARDVTCQLLSEETEDYASSLESAESWRYIRK